MAAGILAVRSPRVEYRSIPGCAGYRAGSDGSIWSRRKTKDWARLKPDLRREDGRARYTVCRDNGQYLRTYGARLVLLAFRGPCPAGKECCHRNGNCRDDRIGNLRWGTRLSNCRDKIRHGTQPAGENHHKTKLSDRDIVLVIKQRKRGDTLAQIAARFNVSEQRVWQIIKKGSR